MKKIKSLIILLALMATAFGITYFENGFDFDAFKKAAPPTENITPGSELKNAEHIKIAFLNVGQGDCIFITTENYFNILIDGGEAENAENIKNYMKKNGIEKIDAVVATHPHADHIGALAEITESSEIGSVYMPKAVHTSKTYKNLLVAVKEKGLKVNTAKNGVKINTGGKAKAEFISPLRDNYDDLNNWSAVLRLEYGNNVFLFMGDAETEIERELLQIGADLKADVLKVGHHGSSTSTSDEFLDAVSPRYAVIMCGKDNSYNHPHKETMEKLTKAGVQIFRSDEAGTIEIYSDGNNLGVEPH